jgi:putative membrane fusion protein
MTNKNRSFLSKRGVFVLFGLLVAILFIYIYILPNVSDAFRRTDVIEYGVIQVKDEVTCYIVRDETVYTAPSSGLVQYYINEGEQVRSGTKIMDIAQNAVVCTAEKRGMVSYFLDGYEGLFKPATMKELGKETVDQLDIEVTNMNGSEATAGEPLYKIVDGDIWYAITWINKESIIKYEKNKEITLIQGDSSIKGVVEDIIKSGDSFLVILKFDRYWQDMTKVRKIEAEVITADYKGLTISNESITTVNGKTGVYIKDVSGNYIFRPIKIITSDGKYSLVECSYYYESDAEGGNRVETVDIYDEVLRNGKPE